MSLGLPHFVGLLIVAIMILVIVMAMRPPKVQTRYIQRDVPIPVPVRRPWWHWDNWWPRRHYWRNPNAVDIYVPPREHRHRPRSMGGMNTIVPAHEASVPMHHLRPAHEASVPMMHLK